MSSGSKKPKRVGVAPELRAWQTEALDTVARSRIAGELVFGGGAALSAVHLHHRNSEDLDFFLSRELEPSELRPLTQKLKRGGVDLEQQQVGPRLANAGEGCWWGRFST